MTQTAIQETYFNWMYDLVCKDRFADENSFRRLLSYLYSMEFTYSISNDSNRADDGLDLRYRFALYTDIPNAEARITGPCSVLEMMVALAINEEQIMHDPRLGDRTAHWFWRMIVSLGLGGMTDSNFDRYAVKDIIYRFLNREYEPNGRGGLFTVDNCRYDLREMEIWTQACYYMDNVCGFDVR